MIQRALTIRNLWIGITVGAAFIGPASTPIGLPDIFWTLLTGAYQVSHGAILNSDPFTSAPPTTGPVLNIQWGADLVFYALNALGGLPMVITGTAVVVASTYALLLAAAVTASGHLRLSCVAVWLAYVLGSSNLSPRPQTLAYPIFALFLLAVMRAEWRKDTRLLWLLPPATALWANLHGSFFTGFVLLGCAAAGRLIATRSLHAALPYAFTLGACVLASLINPYGPGSLVYVASIGSNPVIRDYVTEWAPTTVSWREGIMFFASVGLLAPLALKSRLRLTAVEVLVLIVFGYLAWSSVRAIVWWGLVIAPIVARLSGGVLMAQLPARRDHPLVNGLILAGVVAVAAFSLPWTKTADTDPAGRKARAAQRRHPGARRRLPANPRSARQRPDAEQPGLGRLPGMGRLAAPPGVPRRADRAPPVAGVVRLPGCGVPQHSLAGVARQVRHHLPRAQRGRAIRADRRLAARSRVEDRL